MPKKDCFVKISSDTLSDDVLNWIKELSREYFVVACVGGGTQINEAFAKAGLPIKFGPLGREIASLEGKRLARDVLRKNQAEIQGRLADMGVHACVVIPVIEIGLVLCHVNGDQFTLNAYQGFDILYVVTTKDRVEKKEVFFKPYDEKIHVVGF